MWIYVKLIAARIFHPRTESWIVEMGLDETRRKYIMYRP